MAGMKITVVSQQEFDEAEDFKGPAKWYFINALGDRVYVHCRERSKAIQYVKDEYGGRYTIRTESQEKCSENLTARGYMNSKSRQGSRPVN
jgi:hypothetical protein